MAADEKRTPSQVRGEIEAGERPGKIAGFDPSAAPLETDSEAASDETKVLKTQRRDDPDSPDGTGRNASRQAEAMRDAPFVRSPPAERKPMAWFIAAIGAVVVLAVLIALVL